MLSVPVKSLLMTGMAALTLGAAAAAQAGSFAGNPYSPTAGHEYRHGVVPTVETLQKMRNWAALNPDFVAAATSRNTLAFGGGIDGIGVTSGIPKVYLVVFGSQWGTAGSDSSGNLTLSKDTKGMIPRLQNFFRGLGTGGETWSGVMTQYCDGSLVATGATSCPSGAPHVGYPTGGALAGVWYDNTVSSPSAASGHALAVEAVKAASHFGNTTPASNRFAQYVVLSAPGLNPDHYKTGGFCAWHDYNGDTTLGGGAAASNVGDIAFTNMPYITDVGASCGQGFVNAGTAGTLDGATIVNGHEYAETLSDQNPGGGWINFNSGAENGDECAWISSGQGASANIKLGNGSFPVQSTWSNDTNRCDISHTIL